jgi:hypothetical protein
MRKSNTAEIISLTEVVGCPLADNKRDSDITGELIITYINTVATREKLSNEIARTFEKNA